MKGLIASSASLDSQSIELKSKEEINGLKTSGQMAAELLKVVCERAKAGVTTEELDRVASKWIKEHGAKSAFLRYRGFPKTICTSINDEVVHGIPGSRKIAEGDILSIDVGLFYDGWCGDTAKTVPIGKISPEAKKLLEVSERALEEAILAARAGNRLGDISHAMQSTAESAGYNVVRSYGGHGIGRKMHEDPHISCAGKPGTGLRLSPGIVLALEVMVNAGTFNLIHKPDHWTVVTEDGLLSTHFEHMVAIRESGTEVLTRI